jgi:acetylornithine deacetylase
MNLSTPVRPITAVVAPAGAAINVSGTTQPLDTPTDSTLQWARRLVQFSTISHQCNLALIECIADHLRSLHIPLRLTYDDERRKANLFATIGAGKPGGVVLSGHTDTVPWDGQNWSMDPLAALVQDGRLYGRGSADMKGFIGAAVAQAHDFIEADLPHALHFAFSYDEEVGGFGVRNMVADLKEAGIAPSLCIVGEPTDMVPATAHKGVHRWRCCIKGRAAHSSQAPMAVNAIEAGARVVARIADMADAWRDRGPFNHGFDVPHTTAAVGQMQGGIADNVVPEDCWFHYEFRDLPGSDVEAMQQQVLLAAQRLEPAMKALDPRTGFRFEMIGEMPAFLAPPGDPAVALAQRLAGHDRTALVAFGTEAGVFQGAGIATVICGPGSIGQAHQADEFVSLQQLAQCERFLAALRVRG